MWSSLWMKSGGKGIENNAGCRKTGQLMDSSLTDDQLLIRAAADDFLADASGSAAVRAAMESGTGFDAGTWQRIAV